MIDDTWEPVELPVPPHMRSVPLTYQQVEAQLPPAEVCDSKKTYDDPFDEFAEFQDGYIEQDGCHVKWLETYGPALTRLTAHQAINVLKVDADGCPCQLKPPLVLCHVAVSKG